MTCGQPTGSEDTGLQPLGMSGEQGVSMLEPVGSEGRIIKQSNKSRSQIKIKIITRLLNEQQRNR